MIGSEDSPTRCIKINAIHFLCLKISKVLIKLIAQFVLTTVFPLSNKLSFVILPQVTTAQYQASESYRFEMPSNYANQSLCFS